MPLYFISPTPFNLLGIDRWIRNFVYLTYFDSFEGTHSGRVRRWERGYGDDEVWGQVIITEASPNVELFTATPRTGVWRIDDDGRSPSRGPQTTGPRCSTGRAGSDR